jgi:hypothetical protein
LHALGLKNLEVTEGIGERGAANSCERLFMKPENDALTLTRQYRTGFASQRISGFPGPFRPARLPSGKQGARRTRNGNSADSRRVFLKPGIITPNRILLKV